MDEDLETRIHKKFIRNTFKPPRYHPAPHEDPMIPSSPPPISYEIPKASEIFPVTTVTPIQDLSPPPAHHNPFSPETFFPSPPQQQPSPSPAPPRFIPVAAPQPPSTILKEKDPSCLHCVDVCRHVQKCPVCSQVYRPYTGMFLTIIAVLVLVILFLLKKIFQF